MINFRTNEPNYYKGVLMHNVQLKLPAEYHDKLMAFCKRNGATKTDAVRYMIDTLQLTEVNDVEFDRWYDTRKFRD